MAKNIRKFLAMTLVICMFVSALPMQALAAENEITFTETDTISGGDVVITITPSESNNGSSSVLISGTNESGATVDMNGTTSSSETILSGTETTADGTKKDVEYTETTTSGTDSIVTEGSETKTWTEDVQPGQDVPEVKVDLKPGEESTGSASDADDPKVEVSGKDPKEGEDDQEYDYIETTTTTNREVTVNTSEITITENAGEVNMNPTNPEDYEGKVNAGVTLGKGNSFSPENTGTPFIEVEVVDDDGNVVTDENGKAVMIKIPDPEQWNSSWDYQYMDKGERTTSGSTFMVKAEFVRDEAGNIVYDENGFAKWTYAETWGNPNPQPSTTLSKTVGNNMIALWDKNGNLAFTYCIDKGTDVATGTKGYILENLDECDYFPSDESKEMLRAIAQNGYWGTKEGDGSLVKIKDDMTKAINDGLELEFSFTAQNGTVYEYTTKTEEGKALILDMISKMNEGDALVSTQAALWSYSDGYVNGLTGKENLYSHWLMGDMFYGFQTGTTWYGAPDFSKNDPYKSEESVTGGSAGRMWLFYHYLMGLAPEKAKETTIINKDSFLAEEGIDLIIGDKVINEVKNEDADKNNDVYNADLSFTMLVEPSTENGDDLVVYLYDFGGNLIRKARIAGDATNDDDSFSSIEKDGSTYTFTGLHLSENSDITFDLKLQGVQNLQEGVYIYKAVDENGESGYDKGQTLIGVTGGTQEVDLSTKFTVNFNVDEKSEIVAKRVWKHTEDPSTPPSGNKPVPETEDTVPQIYRLNNLQDNLEEIPEEPVPLAAPVITGDNSGMWIAMILLSVMSMVAINIFDKKRQYETF